MFGIHLHQTESKNQYRNSTFKDQATYRSMKMNERMEEENPFIEANRVGLLDRNNAFSKSNMNLATGLDQNLE